MILDSIQDSPLHKLVLCQDGLCYAIAEQAAYRPMSPIYPSMTEEVALQIWESYLEKVYLRVTHNRMAAKLAAQRRISTLH